MKKLLFLIACNISCYATTNYLYSITSGSSTVDSYSINDITGNLTYITSVPTGIDPEDNGVYNNNSNYYTLSWSTNVINMFTINKETGALTPMNPISVPTENNPWSVNMLNKKRYAYVGNNTSNSVSKYSIDTDGRFVPLNPPSLYLGFQPSLMMPDMDDRFLYVNNYAGNKIITFKIEDNGNLTNTGIEINTGVNPRTLLFNGNNHAYLINQGENTLVHYIADETTGVLTEKQKLSSFGQEPIYITFSVNHKLLYLINRQSDNIVIFNIDQNTGDLSYFAKEYSGGVWPRNLQLYGNDSFAYVVNQYSDIITEFSVDQSTGFLTPLTPFSIGTDVFPYGASFTRF